MANYGGFYKGDKKKQKKEKLSNIAKKIDTSSSSLTLPEILPKGKAKNE